MRLGLVFALVACLLGLGGCKHRSLGQPFVPRAYPDGPDGLKQLWSDILGAAQKDEREHVHDLMATTILTDEELHRLLGLRAQPLLPRYRQLMGTLVNRGSVELVAQVYEHKYDALDVMPDDTAGPLTALLAEPHPFWTVRVRKASETRGLRYTGFVYLDGKWRTTNQLVKYLDDAN